VAHFDKLVKFAIGLQHMNIFLQMLRSHKQYVY